MTREFGSATVLPELPEPGRVVEVRGSAWAVTDVLSQGLLRSPADEAVAEAQHVVSLQSLDEDRLGDELQVIWELEVGRGEGAASPSEVCSDRVGPTHLSATGRTASMVLGRTRADVGRAACGSMPDCPGTAR